MKKCELLKRLADIWSFSYLYPTCRSANLNLFVQVIDKSLYVAEFHQEGEDNHEEA